MVLDNANLFFIVVFTSEMCLKIFALRKYYFMEPWNVFDFIVVLVTFLPEITTTFLTEMTSTFLTEMTSTFLTKMVDVLTRNDVDVFTGYHVNVFTGNHVMTLNPKVQI